MVSENPIGIFDSGVGGLSVFKEICALLPTEHLIYVADTAHLPYGAKSAQYIERRALNITHFLIEERHAKAIVVACNTATAAAVTLLRARFTIPIVGMEPAVKPAVAATKSGIIGVLATAGTLTSAKFAHLLHRFGSSARVIVQPCSGWVELVERGELSGAAALAVVEQYVAPLCAAGCDTLVLGCTHYPFLAPMIRSVAGPEVAIIDPSLAVARELERRLRVDGGLNSGAGPGLRYFWTSGDAPAVTQAITTLWPGRPVDVQPLPQAVASSVD